MQHSNRRDDARAAQVGRRRRPDLPPPHCAAAAHCATHEPRAPGHRPARLTSARVEREAQAARDSVFQSQLAKHLSRSSRGRLSNEGSSSSCAPNSPKWLAEEQSLSGERGLPPASSVVAIARHTRREERRRSRRPN